MNGFADSSASTLFVVIVNSGGGLVETWIPDGGFEIEHKKVKTAEGSTVVAECLVRKRSSDELTEDRPPNRKPYLHRVLADCRHDQILHPANFHGLLSVTIPRKPEQGKVVRAGVLPPEPVEIWQREIRALRAVTELWDTGKNRELVARRITERLARAPFHLIASSDGAGIAIAYRATLLIDAIWQQFAREAVGIIHCARCHVLNCARWFLRSQTRNDRQYCSSACRTRAWRQGLPSGSR